MIVDQTAVFIVMEGEHLTKHDLPDVNKQKCQSSKRSGGSLNWT